MESDAFFWHTVYMQTEHPYLNKTLKKRDKNSISAVFLRILKYGEWLKET